MAKREEKIGERLLIRYHDDGTLDEIVALDANGACEFHMEQLDDNLFWMRFSSTKERPLPQELVVTMRVHPAPKHAKFHCQVELD